MQFQKIPLISFDIFLVSHTYTKKIARNLCIIIVVIHKVLILSLNMRRTIPEDLVKFNIGHNTIQANYLQSPDFSIG